MNYKLLLSINYKLFLDDADSFIKFIKDNDPEGKVGGFEIYFDDEKEEEKTFAKDLARLSRENGYIFNVHSRWYRSEDSYNEYLRFVNELALEYGKTITLTLHPVESENKQEAEDFSKNLFARLVQYIKEKDYKLDLCIENLNILHGLDRLAIVEV
ncbi:MAG: hypothetical protein MJ246_03345 [Clostridia bacterium]|nr:hypothetical protein [Clostridia bacterium]